MVVSLKFYISGGGYDYKQSFSGRVSQLVMMSRALEADEVAQVQCSQNFIWLKLKSLSESLFNYG